MPKCPKDVVRIPEELKPDSKRDHAWSWGDIHSDQEKARRMFGKDSIAGLWELYPIGYKMAGDLLIENANNYTDFLIYPIVFSYRHCIELRLKQISIYGNKLLKSQVFTEKKMNDILFHDRGLDSLWGYSRTIIEKLFPDESEENLSSIKKMIDCFSTMDSTSFKFRYPIDTEGNPNHPIDQDIAISFIALKKMMDDLGSYLGSIAECVYDMRGHGLFLPGESKMNGEQIKELLALIEDSGKRWALDEIPLLIKEKYGLNYSPEQVISHSELCALFLLRPKS
jgi:hypothetical protein